MATSPSKIVLKKSSVAGKVPGTSDLELGEIAINYADGLLYYKDSSNTIQSIGSFGLEYIKITSNYTASENESLLTDTSGGSFTVFLPSSPSLGNKVTISDIADSWQTNNLTIDRNGSTISGLSENVIADISGGSVTLIYDGVTWHPYTKIGVSADNESIVTNIAGTPSIQADTRANQPTPGNTGRIYIVTDENVIERDNGSAWESLGGNDADTLNGLNSTQFIRSDTDDSTTGSLSVGGTVSVGGGFEMSYNTATKSFDFNFIG